MMTNAECWTVIIGGAACVLWWAYVHRLAGMEESQMSVVLTAEEIQELREKLNGITPLPWCSDWMSGAIRHIVRNVDTDAFHDHDGDIEECNGPGRHDGAAIAALMNAAPALLATIDALTAELSTLRTLLSDESMERLAERIGEAIVEHEERLNSECCDGYAAHIFEAVREWRAAK